MASTYLYLRASDLIALLNLVQRNATW